MIMKNKLIGVSALVSVGVVSAMGVAPAQLNLITNGDNSKLNTNSYNTGYVYSTPQESNYGGYYSGQGWLGNFGQDGVHNTSSLGGNLIHHRQNTTVELGKDARYEFTFEMSLNQQGNGDLAMGGMYLAGNNGSVYFGNAQLGRNDNRRDAVMVKYNADIAEYNDSVGEDVYFPNGEFEYKLQSPFDYHKPVDGLWYTVVDGSSDNNFDSGKYRFEIVIESFADAAMQDQLYLYANTPDGKKGVWADKDFIGLGFSHNASFDAAGFVLHNDGASTATAEKMTGHEYMRSLRPVIEPDPEPAVPEPSAFGLLAGLFALGFVGSRRNRSK